MIQLSMLALAAGLLPGLALVYFTAGARRQGAFRNDLGFGQCAANPHE